MKHSPEFLKIAQAAKSQVNELSIEQVQMLINDKAEFTLIDVREDHEWVNGHIPNAIHLGKGVIERDIEKIIPDSNRKLVLYCGGGFRSALAAQSLQQMGYTNVFSMDGGLRGWKSQGLTIESVTP